MKTKTSKLARCILSVINIGAGVYVGKKVSDNGGDKMTAVAAGICTAAVMDAVESVGAYALARTERAEAEKKLEDAKRELEQMKAEASTAPSMPRGERPACADKAFWDMSEDELASMEAWLGCTFNRADIAAAKDEMERTKRLIEQSKGLIRDTAE